MMPNRYGAALDPQGAGPAPGAPPPSQGPPPGPPPGAPPDGQPGQAAPPDPALVEAVRVLKEHKGPMVELLKDPETRQHVKVFVEATDKDPVTLRAVVAQVGQAGWQQLHVLLAQAEQSGKPPTHWLAR